MVVSTTAVAHMTTGDACEAAPARQHRRPVRRRGEHGAVLPRGDRTPLRAALRPRAGMGGLSGRRCDDLPDRLIGEAPGPRAIPGAGPPGFESFAFSVDDLEQAIAEFERAGVTWAAEVVESPWYRYRSFYDPEGNLLHLTMPDRVAARPRTAREHERRVARAHCRDRCATCTRLVPSIETLVSLARPALAGGGANHAVPRADRHPLPAERSDQHATRPRSCRRSGRHRRGSAGARARSLGVEAAILLAPTPPRRSRIPTPPSRLAPPRTPGWPRSGSNRAAAAGSIVVPGLRPTLAVEEIERAPRIPGSSRSRSLCARSRPTATGSGGHCWRP